MTWLEPWTPNHAYQVHLRSSRCWHSLLSIVTILSAECSWTRSPKHQKPHHGSPWQVSRNPSSKEVSYIYIHLLAASDCPFDRPSCWWAFQCTAQDRLVLLALKSGADGKATWVLARSPLLTCFNRDLHGFSGELWEINQKTKIISKMDLSHLLSCCIAAFTVLALITPYCWYHNTRGTTRQVILCL